MKKLFTIILIILCKISFGQNDYDKGFQNGYQEGYCYNDFGCIAPIPPITPIPLIGESNDNYQDGYNRGFKRGLEDKQTKKSNSGGYNGGQGTYVPQQSKYVSQYVPLDYNLLQKSLERKEQQYERNEQIKKEKAIELMKQVKSYYSSLNDYPDKLNDGWHKVISTNNYDFCDERRVYVEDNKVTRYFIEDFEERYISYPSIITKGKTLVQLLQNNGSNGDMVELYFLEFINNPNSIASAPLELSSVSFWTNWNKASTMKLYFDGKYCCVFDSYFENGTPSCGQEGTIEIWVKPGTYNYKIVSNSKTWSGTVLIKEGGCSLHCIVKPTQPKNTNQNWD